MEHSTGGCHETGISEGGSGTMLAASSLCAQVLCVMPGWADTCTLGMGDRFSDVNFVPHNKKT